MKWNVSFLLLEYTIQNEDKIVTNIHALKISVSISSQKGIKKETI